MTSEKTVFKRVDLDLSSLLTYIDLGDIGLPDIQRPFVWSATRVRDMPPSEYLPLILPLIKAEKLYSEEDWNQMCGMHALPDGREHLPYLEFLEQRRLLITEIIRKGYEAV